MEKIKLISLVLVTIMALSVVGSVGVAPRAGVLKGDEVSNHDVYDQTNSSVSMSGVQAVAQAQQCSTGNSSHPSTTPSCVDTGIKGDAQLPVAVLTYSVHTRSPQKPAPFPAPYQRIAFNASGSYAPGGMITNYVWDFGDRSTATGPVVDHAYNNTESYSVTLTVTDSKGYSNSAYVTIDVKIKNLFTFYVAFDNSFGTSERTMTNLSNMMKAAPSDYNLSVIIFLDLPGTEYDGTWWVSADGLIPLWRPPSGEVDSGWWFYFNTLNSPFWKTDFKADRYMLDVWDHGDGYRGVCFDDTSHDFIPVYMMEPGRHYDLIAFNACLMDMVEVAYQLKDRADVMTASEESMWMTGDLPYPEIFSWLRANPDASARALGQQIVSKYMSTWEWSPDPTKPIEQRVTYAAVDLTKVKAVKIALDNLADVLIPNFDAYKDPINSAINDTQRYPWDSKTRDFADIIHFTENLDKYVHDPKVAAADANVRAAVQGAVIKAGALGIIANGLSVWLPSTYLATKVPEYNFTYCDSLHSNCLKFSYDDAMYNQSSWTYFIWKLCEGYNKP